MSFRAFSRTSQVADAWPPSPTSRFRRRRLSDLLAEARRVEAQIAAARHEPVAYGVALRLTQRQRRLEQRIRSIAGTRGLPTNLGWSDLCRQLEESADRRHPPSAGRRRQPAAPLFTCGVAGCERHVEFSVRGVGFCSDHGDKLVDRIRANGFELVSLPQDKLMCIVGELRDAHTATARERRSSPYRYPTSST